MTEAAPLRCPFCGSDAVQMEREDDEGAWFGHCQRCDTEGPATLSKGVAIAAWNRRAPQADLAAMSADELRTRLQVCLEVQRETAAHNRRLRGELDGEIAPQAEPVAWQPIETAPKDGGTVLLLVPTRLGKWNKALPLPGIFARFWMTYNADEAVQRVEPTHWQPLPAPPGATPQGAEPQAEQPASFDCALIVRCAKWCGKEKCRDHDAIAHAALVKAARLALKVAAEMHELADNWPGIAYSYDLDERTKAAIATLRAALPPEGAA